MLAVGVTLLFFGGFVDVLVAGFNRNVFVSFKSGQLFCLFVFAFHCF